MRLTPVIRGWVNYYATVASKRTFSLMQHLTFVKLLRWATRRHPTKSAHWVVNTYWHVENGPWDFRVKNGPRLVQHAKKPITRHVKVEGTRSLFDGDWAYWATRLGPHPELPREVAYLLKRQQGRCAWCGLYFKSEDIRERDHIIPTSKGGPDDYRNRQLLHGHCHDKKTARDGSLAGGAHDNGPDS